MLRQMAKRAFSARLFSTSTLIKPCRFRVKDEIRLLSPLVREQLKYKPWGDIRKLRIEEVYCDVAGTTGDAYCNAPLASFIEAFYNCFGFNLSQEDAQGPMGVGKKEHIRELFKKLQTNEEWQRKFANRLFSEADVNRVYEEYRRLNQINIEKYTIAIEGMPETVAKLRKMGIRVRLNTAYSFAEAAAAVKGLAKSGLIFSFEKKEIITMDDIKPETGRPYPGLLEGLQARGGATNRASIVSVFDGIPDLLASIRFHCWSVAQVDYSTNVGITQSQAQQMSANELLAYQHKAEEKFKIHGPNYITRKPENMLAVVDDANIRLSKGEHPLFFPDGLLMTRCPTL